MKIFITGATGYIGFAVASALAARGHQVFGLVRSEEKSKKIASAEIQPVIGSMEEPDSYYSTARACELSIHCAAEMSEHFHQLDRKTVETLIKARGGPTMKRRIIYTSGVWLYGNTGHHLVDETDCLNPPDLVKPRMETEAMVLAANAHNLVTLSVRPGCVYGGTGGLTADWFHSAFAEKRTQIIGDGHFRWAMVHVNDLADLYVRLAESNFANETFNATDRSRFTVLECAQAVNRIVNKNDAIHAVTRTDAEQQLGALAECLMLDQHIDSSKANRLLGWQPKQGGFVDGVLRYFTAWKNLNAQK